MTKAAKRPQPASDYEVGYRKPPVHTRFRKGQSGNPRGRPRDGGIERTRRIVLEEAYRKVTVREGEKVVEMPAIRAVMRSHLRDALKGNGPNQRAVLGLVQALESQTKAEKSAIEANDNELAERDPNEIARSIAFVLAEAARSANET